MGDASRIEGAREFVRSLNAVLKSVRLYGFQHSRTSAQVDASWKLLSAVLGEKNGMDLLLAVSGTQLLVDGAPLEATAAERSFAELLCAAGIASMQFSVRATREDFGRFVRAFEGATGKASGLAEQLKAAFGESAEAPVRINRVRFVAEDAEYGEGKAGMAAGALLAHTLGPEGEKLKEWLKEPQKLLQLIAASEGVKTESGSPPAAPQSPAEVPAAQEEDVMGMIRLLAHVAQAGAQPRASVNPGQLQKQFAGMPVAAQVSMREALASLAATRLPPGQPPSQVLVQLAEQLAIRHALERFQRGEARVDAVREMLERTGREIQNLRKILGSYEEKMGRAGMAVESHAEILDRQFWMQVPESGKRTVLLSAEAWCIPPRNISLYLEQLLGRGDSETANAILRNYAGCVRSGEAEARRKVALGLGELAKLYASASDEVLTFAIAQAGRQLSRESLPDVQSQLGEAFVRLSQAAAAQRRYPVIEQVLNQIQNLADSQPALAQNLRPRIGVESRIRDFTEEAARAESVPAGLTPLLRRIPHLAADEVAGRFRRCVWREERERLVELMKEIGQDGLARLRETLHQGPDAAAVATVGLLSRLAPAALEEAIPARLPKWGRTYHDALIRQLAFGGAPERAGLLLKLLPLLDPLLLPVAIDEIGMTGDRSAAPFLMQVTAGELHQFAAPFLHLKAIEALGRLREPGAMSMLRQLLEAKRAFGWQHPRELRVVTAQALAKMDPAWAKSGIAATGLTPAELELAPPLDPDASGGWCRARRYPRLTLALPLPAALSTDRSKSRLAIKALNLGGGLAACDTRLPSGSAATLDLRSGFRSIHADVLVHEAREDQVTFEIVGMDFEERSKLRKLLAGLKVVAV